MLDVVVSYNVPGGRIKVFVPGVFRTKVAIGIILRASDVASTALSENSRDRHVLGWEVEGVILGHDGHLSTQRDKGTADW